MVHPTPDSTGGSERVLKLTVAALRERGHLVDFLVGGGAEIGTDDSIHGESRTRIYDGRHFDGSPSALLSTLSNLSPLRSVIRERHIDLVHIHLNPNLVTFNALVRLAPTVVTAHVPFCPNGARYRWRDGQACDQPIGVKCMTEGFFRHGCGHLGNAQPIRFTSFAFATGSTYSARRLMNRCKAIVAPSRWQAERLIGDGIAADLVHVLPPPVVAEGGTMGHTSLTRSHSTGHIPVVAYIGRLVEFKGVRDLLRASRMVREPFRLWIIGEGPELAQLREDVHNLQLGNRTRFLGNLPVEKVHNLLRQTIDVVVVPSRWPETFNLSGAEARALGVPVVLARSGGVSEWAAGSVPDALTFNPGDVHGLAKALSEALRALPASRGLDNRPSGHRIADDFSMQGHISSLIRIYGSAMQP